MHQGVKSESAQKRENALEDVALIAGTQQNLTNLYSLDIYGAYPGCQKHTKVQNQSLMRFGGPRQANRLLKRRAKSHV
jgi:hypothetical protein